MPAFHFCPSALVGKSAAIALAVVLVLTAAAPVLMVGARIVA